MTARRFYVCFLIAASSLFLYLFGTTLVAQDSRPARSVSPRGVATLGGNNADFEGQMPVRPIPSTTVERSEIEAVGEDLDSSLDEFPTIPESIESGAATVVEESPKRESEDLNDSKEPFLKDVLPDDVLKEGGDIIGSAGLTGALKAALVMAVFALAPALLLMTTCYARISVALSFVRQGLGAGQVPSNQIIIAFSLLLTALVMAPVGIEIYNVAVVPYQRSEISGKEAVKKGVEPLRDFLCRQIEKSGNGDAITLLAKHMPNQEEPQYYEDASIVVVAPAFLLSELKTAFLIGFQILLPFLIVDLVVSTVLVASGMMMLPPALVSLPFKLALFVMVDGWTLVVKSLLESFA